MNGDNEKRTVDSTATIDREIEADIKHLKRSSNLLAALGLMIIVLFIVLLGIKVRQSVGKGQLATLADFLDVGSVVQDTATVYEQPVATSAKVATLKRDDAVFIIDDKPSDWYRVEVFDNTAGERHEYRGWIPKADVRTRTELQQLRKDLANQPGKAIDILDVSWTVDEVGNYTISGKVVNLTEVPLKNIKVIVTFYDKDNNIVEQRYTYVATETPLTDKNPIPFAFIGKNETTFNFVNCRADYRFDEEN